MALAEALTRASFEPMSRLNVNVKPCCTLCYGTCTLLHASMRVYDTKGAILSTAGKHVLPCCAQMLSKVLAIVCG